MHTGSRDLLYISPRKTDAMIRRLNELKSGDTFIDTEDSPVVTAKLVIRLCMGIRQDVSLPFHVPVVQLCDGKSLLLPCDRTVFHLVSSKNG